jgi:signal transduction histidine kinase
MIETVLENLLDNAATHAPAGSEILIRLRRGGDIAHIEVSDRGPGVPPAHLEQIFERYFSSRPSADENKPSDRFGIGLSIARRNVEAMYGTIEAENRTPHGLIVHIRLPIAPRIV